jgi:hypothetical protein
MDSDRLRIPLLPAMETYHGRSPDFSRIGGLKKPRRNDTGTILKRLVRLYDSNTLNTTKNRYRGREHPCWNRYRVAVHSCSLLVLTYAAAIRHRTSPSGMIRVLYSQQAMLVWCELQRRELVQKRQHGLEVRSPGRVLELESRPGSPRGESPLSCRWSLLRTGVRQRPDRTGSSPSQNLRVALPRASAHRRRERERERERVEESSAL